LSDLKKEAIRRENKILSKEFLDGVVDVFYL